MRLLTWMMLLALGINIISFHIFPLFGFWCKGEGLGTCGRRSIMVWEVDCYVFSQFVRGRTGEVVLGSVQYYKLQSNTYSLFSFFFYQILPLYVEQKHSIVRRGGHYCYLSCTRYGIGPQQHVQSMAQLQCSVSRGLQSCFS